jgi:glycosyltransferase involved in cell wall biosynthesis
VVAADAPGAADLLGGGERSGGIVVPRADADALAAALGRLLDDEQRSRRLGARARQRVEQRFSLEEVGAELREFLTLRVSAPGRPG